MYALFHQLGITDVWQLIAATMVFLMLPGPGTFCVLTSAGQRGLRGGFASMDAVISSCTLFYGSFLVLAGNAAAKRLASNQRIASWTSKAAGTFLIGFGIKLTTN